MGTPFIAAAYYRLSVEDSKSSGSASDESESIINQRNLVRDYCRKNQITLVEEFVDDGYSGSNFNRPGFLSVMKAVEAGEVIAMYNLGWYYSGANGNVQADYSAAMNWFINAYLNGYQEALEIINSMLLDGYGVDVYESRHDEIARVQGN